MQTEAIFENIASRIQEEINKAQKSIYIAVAWFTNKNIFDQLLSKAKEGCAIHVIISNDEINNNSSINFKQLTKHKGKVYKIGNGDNELMHNKFCVIDYNTVITGSYNWSYKAENNFENIVINYNDTSLAEQFVNEFVQIKKTLIPKVTNTLNITNKLIFANNRKLVMEIFERNPKLFINLISKYYPLNQELIENYEEKLDWGSLSKNNFIPWSNYLFAKFKHNWCWWSLSMNNSFKQSDELDEKFKDIFDFSLTIVTNPSVIEDPWSIEFFEKNKNDYNWNYICSNIPLPWSSAFIEKYSSEWNWLCLSKNKYLPFSIHLIHKYAEKWWGSEPIWETLKPFIDNEMIREILSNKNKTSKIRSKVISRNQPKEKTTPKIITKIVKRTTLKEKIKEAVADPKVKDGTLFIAGVTIEKDNNGICQMIAEVVQKKQFYNKDDKFRSNTKALHVWLKITPKGFDAIFAGIGITGSEIQEKTANLTREQALMTFLRVKSIQVDGEEETPTISYKQFSAENGLPNRIQKILDIKESERSTDQDAELKRLAMRNNEDEPLVDEFGNQVYQMNELTYGDEEDHIYIKKMPLSKYEKKFKK